PVSGHPHQDHVQHLPDHRRGVQPLQPAGLDSVPLLRSGSLKLKPPAFRRRFFDGNAIDDPLKDTVGPSLDILIKIMSNVSLVTVVVFNKFNIMAWLMSLIG
ncbi:MAG: sodium/proton-translocating pyrophosphatase, partial [Clostridia bacterium]|nr:sodium/proton-translocating pyrophosphatase [Clostridia bacterium]